MCDHAIAASNTSNTTPTQAPCASAAHAFVQLTAQSHQTIQRRMPSSQQSVLEFCSNHVENPLTVATFRRKYSVVHAFSGATIVETCAFVNVRGHLAADCF